jgi:hypothetical protein
MNRRESLKTLLIGGAAVGIVPAISACRETVPAMESTDAASQDALGYLTPQERQEIEALHADQFFSEAELLTLTILADIILPPSEHGGIKEAGVPEFLEFRAKDAPSLQLPLRGGIAWLNHESRLRFEQPFSQLSGEQQISIVDEIASYDVKVPESKRPIGQRFFNLVRNLTLTGYYTSEVGIRDLGYQGNQPNVWDGVPQEILDQHGLAYEPEWLAKCIDQESRETIATWDDAGKLLS